MKGIEEWNKLACLKHIWNLFAQTSSIWVAWVHIKHIEGEDFWFVKAPKTVHGVGENY